jgi:diguanylate cyclase (GGDEF)-like protein/PAS domain S-box-containing protein
MVRKAATAMSVLTPRLLPRMSSGAAIAIVVLLISALFAFFTARFIEEKKHAVEDSVKVLTSNFVGAIDEQVVSSVDKIDLIVRALADQLETQLASKGRVNTRAIDKAAAIDVARIPELDGLRVTDESGKLIAGTGVRGGGPATYGDRDFFFTHRDHADSGLIVSKPLFGRVGRKWVISLTRRYRHADGSFAGVISAAILVDHFTRLLSVLDLGPGGIALIRDADLGMVTRYPPIEGPAGATGNRTASKELTDLVRSGKPKGTFHSAATADGVERTGSYRILSRVPFVVIAGMSSDHYLVGWRSDVHAGVMVVGVFVVVLSLSGLLLWRIWRHLKEQKESFRMLFDSHPLPVWVWDHETFRYLAINDAAVAHYGYSREQFLGMTVLDIRPPEDREVIHQAARYSKGSPRRTDRHVRHLKADGALIDVSVHAQTLHYRGRTATLVVGIDVTERKRAEEELRRTKSFLDTVINHVPAAIIVKDVQDWRFLLTNKKGEEFFGLAREQIIGRTPAQLFEPEAAQLITEQDRRALVADGFEYTGKQLRRGRGGYEVVSTKRLVIRDAKGAPEHLLSIVEDITERVRAAEKTEYMARHDALTGLANRILFAEKAKEALDQLAQSGSAFSILLLDLDLFKTVNDSLGHPVGDELLKAVGARLSASIRDTDIVARLGGDEFAILVSSDGDQRESAVTMASTLLDAVGAPYDVDGDHIDIGTSIGIALAPAHGTDVDQLMKSADLALYKAKGDGRNRFRIFEEAMGIEAKARRALQVDLRNALKDDQFEVHYHPIVEINSGNIASVEALVRWRHPQRGMIAPGDFIPLAEETGLINPIGEWVLRQACSDAVHWPPTVKVSVNLSPVQFRNIATIDMFCSALRDSGLPPERLEVEITESVFLKGDAETVETLHQLRCMGLSIMLDDFGTGYSSLSYLRMFPFDKIKIDRSFVHELSKNTDCGAIVSAVAHLGRNLRIPTVAEGVETEDQLLLVRAAGCTLAQGFLFGQPCPAAALSFRSLRDRMPKITAG